MVAYYSNYIPKDQEKFDRMVKFFEQTKDKKDLNTVTLMFIMDMSYDRQDLLVAMGRRERELGVQS
jgi:hypothetical protein